MDDLTLNPCYVVKQNNLFAHGETLEDARTALREKLFEGMDIEDRIHAFLEEFELGVTYPVMRFYDWHHKLTGSCEMGRKAFAQNHNIDLDNDTLTVSEFIDLVIGDYGGEIIRELKEAVKNR